MIPLPPRSERYEALVTIGTGIAHAIRSEFFDDVSAAAQAALERCAVAFEAAARAAFDVARAAAEQEVLEDAADARRLLS